MSYDPVIREVAREYMSFALTDIEDPTESIQRAYTPSALALKQWSDMLHTTYIGHQPTVYRIAEAKVLLIDRFFSLWHSAPRGERNGGRGRKGLFDILEEAHGRLRNN